MIAVDTTGFIEKNSELIQQKVEEIILEESANKDEYQDKMDNYKYVWEVQQRVLEEMQL